MHVTTSGRTWKAYDAGTLTLTILITFQFDVTGIHIVEEFGSSTEWPNHDGHFDLAGFRRECTLKVEGNLRSIHAQAANPRPSPTSVASYSPLFRFVLGDAFFTWMKNNISRKYGRRARGGLMENLESWLLGIGNLDCPETLTTMNNCSCFKGLSFRMWKYIL